MLLGAAFITNASLEYFDFEELPAFVIEKLPVRFEALWLASLRVHVASALLSFPLCLWLMTRWLQRRATWHRWIGRLTGVLVLFALVPSGVVLSFEAKGGAPVTAGFLLSAVIVAGYCVRGIAAARRRELVSHRRAMQHVLGQMSVAVVSRVMIVGFDALGADPDLAYVVALWVPVVASVLIVELASVRKLLAEAKNLLFERIRREVSPLEPARVVRVGASVRANARSGR
ncbi:MAG: DUF2306 domain-containing protein [Myxococcota bacterium]